MNEGQLLAQAAANPHDVALRLVLADWLEERGDPRAELLRIQERLRKIGAPRRQELEARMQQLLLDGVQPVVPRWTNAWGMPFVFVFPGEFISGDKREQVKDAGGYWMGETVVTQSQWRHVMRTEPWRDREFVQRQDDCPATFVSWPDAIEFCRELSAQDEPYDYMLPNESQWEYACRAGTTSSYSFGSDDANLSKYGWFKRPVVRLNEDYAHPVGTKTPNPWGLFDIHGNVFEWCMDEWKSADFEGVTGLTGPHRACRGGAWASSAIQCRVLFRRGAYFADCFPFLGFRVLAVPRWNAAV